jgi:hypothetical protein
MRYFRPYLDQLHRDDCAAAQPGASTDRPAIAEPPARVTLDLPQGRLSNSTMPTRLEIVGWSPPAASPFETKGEQGSAAPAAVVKKAHDASTAGTTPPPRPGWRVKDGKTLTKGEKAVLKVVQDLLPKGDGSARGINEKIKKALEALPVGDRVVGLTTIKSARSKIYFFGAD